jgi:FtsP/CotA-like multicopper oxidase with cupredoxin domain
MNVSEAGKLDARSPRVIELTDGELLEMSIGPVHKRIGDVNVPMLAYNGSIPGPTLRVKKGSALTVRVKNETDMETTVHWHGLRLENRFDGVPHDTQAPIPPGGAFTYGLRFPDEGIYWYHPHMREDYGQEMGLYGAIVVVPDHAEYWPRVHRDIPLLIDDILIADDQIAPFGGDNMGRFGNVYLVNGETDFSLDAVRGEVVRFYLANVANVRNLTVGIPGSSMKLIGADIGRCEREEMVEWVSLAPGERAVVDVLFERPGVYELQYRRSHGPEPLGKVIVGDRPAVPPLDVGYQQLRTRPELRAERRAIEPDIQRPPDKVLELIGEMPGMSHDDTPGLTHDASGGSHEEMDHEAMHAAHGAAGMGRVVWKLVDRETGAVNNNIRWTFSRGDRTKVRLINRADVDHPMAHPFHVHGERFLVLSRDGVANTNLAWKDTMLVGTGETVDILIEMSNPGTWMAHCHIAEHAEAGMMFNFRVVSEAAAR